MDKTPMFIKIDEYKDIFQLLEVVKNKLDDSKHIFNQIVELNQQENDELISWKKAIEDVEKRFSYLEGMLSEE
jgi:predicted nuclease with TOPRIM domain